MVKNSSFQQPRKDCWQLNDMKEVLKEQLPPKAAAAKI